MRDLRHALRQLQHAPVFTAAAVATLALGIGATTAIFTLVEQVMLQQLPVAQPEQLWRIGDAVTCCHWNGYAPNDWSFFSHDAYQHFRANTPAFESLAAMQVGQAELAVRRPGSSSLAEARIGEYVSGNFFATFGVRAWRGRVFTDADDQEGAAPVAVLSYQAWSTKYASDSSVVGATYDINGHSFTIIGITPPGFFGAKIAGSGMPELWLPLSTEPLIDGATARLRNPALGWLDLIGRVRGGTDPRALETQLQVELHQWLGSHAADLTPDETASLGKQTLHLTPGGAGVTLMRREYEDGLRLLLLAAACVLLVACANIANLLLARGLRDRPTTALRVALGASRARIVRRALVQSTTLGTFGGVAGIIVAYSGARLILYLAAAGRDDLVSISASPSLPILFFALGVSFITGIAFGIVPAWVTSRADPVEALNGASRTVGAGRHWAQRTLVIAQAAASIVLLSVAAMLGRSLRNLEHQQLGFESNGRYMVSIDTKISNLKPEQMPQVVRAIEDKMRAIPGVSAASPVLYAPLNGLSWSHDIRIENRPEPGPTVNQSANWTRVVPNFFDVIGDRVVEGRAFTDGDDATSRPVAVINEAFAKKYYGNANPIGQHFGPAPSKNSSMYEIVGVVRDARFFEDVADSIGPMYFVPEAQTTRFAEPETESREIWSHYPYTIVLVAPSNAPMLEARVRSALAAIDPTIVFHGIDPYTRVVRRVFAQQRMIADLAGLFGVVALLLAAVGLYGVTAYFVEQRTREIGVRIALGADRVAVMRLVLRDALTQVAVGLALGIPSAIAVGGLIAAQLFGVAPWDPALLGGASLLLGLATLIAATIPAVRAASVSPMDALRSD